MSPTRPADPLEYGRKQRRELDQYLANNIPNTAHIRFTYAAHYAYGGFEDGAAQFDAWLAQHDEKVRNGEKDD